MEICKTKKSNQYFIYIVDTGKTEILLVTPDAQLKSLKNDLFEEIEGQEESYILQSKLLTEDQVKRLHEYKEARSDEIVEQERTRSDEIVEQVIEEFKKMLPNDQKRFIQKLQEMVVDK